MGTSYPILNHQTGSIRIDEQSNLFEISLTVPQANVDIEAGKAYLSIGSPDLTTDELGELIASMAYVFGIWATEEQLNKLHKTLKDKLELGSPYLIK